MNIQQQFSLNEFQQAEKIPGHTPDGHLGKYCVQCSADNRERYGEDFTRVPWPCSSKQQTIKNDEFERAQRNETKSY